MKHFNFRKEKYSCLFLVIAILTNFLHKCYLDFMYKVIGDQIENATKYSWHGHF
jgi:hypothetical protein